MPDMEKVINGLREMSFMATWKDIDRIRHRFQPIINDAVALLKEQDELLKHEYWRGYNNGRKDERGLQDGTIMQTFSPD